MNTHLKSDERGDLTVDSIAGATGAAIVVPAMTSLLVGLWSVSSMTGEVTRGHIELADLANEAVISGERFGDAGSPQAYGPDDFNAVVWESTAEEGPVSSGFGELSGTELPSTEQYWLNASAPKQAEDVDCSPAALPNDDCLSVAVPVTDTVGGFALSEILSATDTTSVNFDVGDNPAEIRYTGWLSHRCEGAELVASTGTETQRRSIPAGDDAFVYGSVNFIGADGLPMAADNVTLSVESDCGVTFEDLLIYEGPTR